MKNAAVPCVLAVLLSVAPALAQDPAPAAPPCPEPYSLCLTQPDSDTVVSSLRELKSIKESKAVLKLKDSIVIVRDWQDRVYVNGGSAKPIDATLTLGDTVSRDMQIQLPVQVYYRPKPPDPMFRLRVRAQAGLLLPVIWKDAKGGWDAGLSFDFFHVGDVNMAAYTGVRSAGGGVGLDLTRNFGPYVGYALVYDGLQSGLLGGCFFSFN
jgi:hypothetical protein